MKKPDCYYYGGGYCDKGLPFTPCEIEGCVCYIPSPKKKDMKVVNELYEKPQPPVRLQPELTWQDIAIILTIYEEGDYPKHGDASKMEVYSKEILKKFKEIKRK